MEEKSNGVLTEGKHLPLVVNQIFDQLCLEDGELLRVGNGIGESSLDLTDHWQKIGFVLDLEDFVLVLVKFTSQLQSFKFLVVSPDRVINSGVLVSQFEHRLVVRSKNFIGVHVGSGPLIEVKDEIEYVGLEERSHLNSLFDQVNKVIFEEMREHVGVLELDYVVDHEID